MALKSNLKWILIDLDNTLVASTPWRLKIFFIYYFCRECANMNISLLNALRLLKQMKNALYQEGPLTNLERAARIASAEMSSTQMQVLLTNIFVAMKNEFRPVKGANELVRSLKKNYRLVLATNPVWPLAVTSMRLNLIGLTPEDFDLVTHNENMSSVKPNPFYFKEILEKINAAPYECLMIGDNPLKDGTAALLEIPTLIVHQKNSLQQQIEGILP